MSTAYGYDIQPKKDYFVSLAEDAVSRLSFAMLPGAALVNAIPIMQYLPSWFPGAGFQKIAAESREVTRRMKEVPFQWAENNIVHCAHFKFAHPLTYVRRTDFRAVIWLSGCLTTSVVQNTRGNSDGAGVCGYRLCW